MSKRLEILTEEPSMEVFLKGLLPRILPEGYTVGINCFVIPHEGKNDLQRRLPKRVRAYTHYPEDVLLLVIQDQDSNDCIVLKQKLNDLIRESNPKMKSMVRIACRELENWYLGDLPTVEVVYPMSKASRYMKKAKYRNVDRLTGSEEMKKLSSRFGKTSCARNMAPLITIESNRSPSFNQFVNGLTNFLK